MAFLVTGLYVLGLFGVAMWFIHRHDVEESQNAQDRRKQERRHHGIPA
jgi:hypothetical protein